MAGLDFLFHENDGDTSALDEHDEGPGRVSSVASLARLALAEALGPEGARRLRKSGIAVVIRCPDASWVDAVKGAAAGSWAAVYARAGATKTTLRGEGDNEAVRNDLAGGRSVLGVSHDPERLLPSALISAADVMIDVALPSGRTIAKTIRAASGRSPGRVPDGIAASLSYHEICAAIRLDATPASSIRRLRAASASKALLDPLVASAPPFESLAGYGEAQLWGAALIDNVAAWRRGDIPLSAVTGRNVLLASEPGLGKTSMCRSLAKSAGLNLVSSSVASWFTTGSGYLEGVLRQMEAAFAAAAAASPSLLLLDEIDSLPSRAGLDADRASWWGPVITGTLLACDRLIADPRAMVAIVGCTNHPEKLDAALIRPGRLDRVIYLTRPDPRALVGIVRTHLGEDLADEDIEIVGSLGDGATGAVAAGWVARARATAIRSGRPMALADLTDAIAPPTPRSEKALKRSAIHEAGHALAISLAGGRVRTVSIVGGDREGGRVVQDAVGDEIPVRADLDATVISLLAGRAAEILVLGHPSAGSGGDDESDLGRATHLVSEALGGLGLGGDLLYRGSGGRLADSLRFDPAFARRVEAELQRLAGEADALVARNRDIIELIAGELLAKRVLGGDAIRELIAASNRPVV